ncbi:MAG: HAMP domain-containing histidine kinase [Campylobacter sp.]|nr:HAMP domain-containing histidine kinase [Campylobacter sp.]
MHSSSKKYGLPIFLLYMITSIVFLTIFAFIHYDAKKHDIIKSQAHLLENISSSIKYNLRFKESIEIPIGVNVNLYDEKEGKWLSSEFEPVEFKKRRVLIKNDNFYYADNFKVQKKSYYLVLKKSGIDELLKVAKFRVLVAYVVMLGLFFVISYFIIRLSLRPLYAKIEDLNNFITDTTHEIKTPLSVILMSLEMVEKDPPKYLSNIHTATKTLSNLYDDLVSLNLGELENRLIKLDIKNLVEQRVAYFEDIAKTKSLEFELNLDKVSLNTDPIKFSKILDNLISNAIKYSDEKENIVLNLSLDKFSIVNFGESIKKENLDKIFDKFSRFDSQNGGFGIGLSLVKKYTDELGYKISCQSSDKKTKFILMF